MSKHIKTGLLLILKMKIRFFFIFFSLLNILSLKLNNNFFFNLQKYFQLEQKQHDKNQIFQQQNLLIRQLIVLSFDSSSSSSPSSSFSPPSPTSLTSHSSYTSSYSFMYQKEQFSDKCSLPFSLEKQLNLRNINQPWTFEIKKSKNQKNNQRNNKNSENNKEKKELFNILQNDENEKKISKIFISSLDFRAPENYIFVPQWIMKALNLSNFDLIDLRYLPLKSISSITLQLQEEDEEEEEEEKDERGVEEEKEVIKSNNKWSNLLKSYQEEDLQGLLERELSYYSTITKKTSIPLFIKNKIYYIYIKDCSDINEVNVEAGRIQDRDINVQIDRSNNNKREKSSHEKK